MQTKGSFIKGQCIFIFFSWNIFYLCRLSRHIEYRTFENPAGHIPENIYEKAGANWMRKGSEGILSRGKLTIFSPVWNCPSFSFAKFIQIKFKWLHCARWRPITFLILWIKNWLLVGIFVKTVLTFRSTKASSPHTLLHMFPWK